jgi:hypothetical protein
MQCWAVYYWNNDGQKEYIYTCLTYERAVKVWQHLNTTQPHIFGLGYEVMR